MEVEANQRQPLQCFPTYSESRRLNLMYMTLIVLQNVRCGISLEEEVVAVTHFLRANKEVHDFIVTFRGS